MIKAIKKPLLVKFTKDEHDFITMVASKKGVTRTAFIRQLIESLMNKA